MHVLRITHPGPLSCAAGTGLLCNVQVLGAPSSAELRSMNPEFRGSLASPRTTSLEDVCCPYPLLVVVVVVDDDDDEKAFSFAFVF